MWTSSATGCPVRGSRSAEKALPPDSQPWPGEKLGSQRSPIPSPSVSVWPGLGTVGQLSTSPQTLSPSRSLNGSSTQVSQASPAPSLSVFSWPALGTSRQLSVSLQAPSASESTIPIPAQPSHRSPIPSPSASSCMESAASGQASVTSAYPSASVSRSGSAQPPAIWRGWSSPSSPPFPSPQALTAVTRMARMWPDAGEPVTSAEGTATAGPWQLSCCW